MRAELRNQALKTIDSYLTYLACADRNLMRYDCSYLMAPDFVDLGVITDDPVCYLGATAADVNHAWDVSVLAHAGPQALAGTMFALYRSYTVAADDARQFWQQMPNGNPRFYECFARQYQTQILADGSVAEDFMFAAYRHAKVTFYDPDEIRIGGLDLMRTKRWNEESQEQSRLALGVAFMEPCFWTAHVRLSSHSPRVSLITDPTGVKELWKFRDIPEGHKRRDALLHWVSEHWRRHRVDPDLEGYVRAQLRGQRRLRCSGLDVEIQESKEDRAKINEAIRERQAMRRSRRDRRRARAR